MNQNEVEAFLAVVEYGTISAAAGHLYIGQTTLSARIKALENELGTPLFIRDRGSKDTHLTPGGKQFESYARKWMRLWEDTNDALRSDREKMLFFTAVHSVNAYVMPEVLHRLQAQGNEKDCVLRIGTSDYKESYRKIESGEADAAIVARTQYSRQVTSMPLFREEMLLVVSRAQNFPETVNPGELDAAHALYCEWNEPYTAWYRYWFDTSKSMRLQTDNLAVSKRLVATDRKWMVVALTAAKKICEEEPELCCVRLTDPPPDRVCSLITKDMPDSIPVLPKLLKTMKQVVTKQGAVWLAN